MRVGCGSWSEGLNEAIGELSLLRAPHAFPGRRSQIQPPIIRGEGSRVQAGRRAAARLIRAGTD